MAKLVQRTIAPNGPFTGCEGDKAAEMIGPLALVTPGIKHK